MSFERLLSPLDEAIDLSETEFKKAFDLTLERFERDAVRLDSQSLPDQAAAARRFAK